MSEIAPRGAAQLFLRLRDHAHWRGGPRQMRLQGPGLDPGLPELLRRALIGAKPSTR